MPVVHPRDIRQTVVQCYLRAHSGYSTDMVLVRDDLRDAFLDCIRNCSTLSDEDALWILLNIRKSANLGPVTTKRVRFSHDEYRHASEIAARLLEDRYDLTLDRVLCNEGKRQEFDRIATGVCPEVEPIQLRLAALGLRKARKLQPEYFKQLDRRKTVLELSANEILAQPSKVPPAPGIYLIRDQHEGYLYVGEASNLRTRVSKHLDHSDRKHLAQYLWANGLDSIEIELHVFAPDSDARLAGYRRAYEAQMIQSRNPKFNIQGRRA